MEIKKKLKNPMVINFISLALLQGVNYLLPLLSFPFLFRVLGVERWGLVTFGYALRKAPKEIAWKTVKAAGHRTAECHESQGVENGH